MASPSSTRKITVKLKNPNPLFLNWLTEWRDQAKENNSKMENVFNLALKSLKKYPLSLKTGRDCGILRGFGNKLCVMLDKKLQEHQNAIHDADSTIIYDVPEVCEVKKSEKKKRVKKLKTVDKSYLPTHRSGAYAILLALYQNHGDSIKFMTKAEIIENGQKFCDKPFKKREPGSFYTAWSSMSTLISKGLIEKKGSPQKFNLTETGFETAEKLWKESKGSEEITGNLENENILQIKEVANNSNNGDDLNNEEIVFEPSVPCNFVETTNEVPRSQESTTIINEMVVHSETIVFSPNSFDVILLVDVKETTSDSENVSELNNHQILYEVRDLKVGDFTWICRDRLSKHELILPYIVERKRMDDLGHSIKDGRFHEQKFRLKRCGVQNVVYIIESHGKNTHTVLPMSSLVQAATNTLVHDRFQVKFTQNLRHSMQYLAGFTKILAKLYQGKTIYSCTKENVKDIDANDDLVSLMIFKDFNKGASKARTYKVREMFARHLLQLKGVSVEKALAIVEKYPTPKLLKMEYDKLGNKGEKLLASLPYGPLKRNIGPVISKSIFQLYTMEKLL